MRRIEISDEIFDTYIEPDDITHDLMDVKEVARINGIISKLRMYSNNTTELTREYTNILMDDNVAFILKKISQDQIFVKHFPEFYVVNQYGENLINCQQNSSYHKYGVFKHILATIESIADSQAPIGDWQKRILKWTMLLHDVGKPYVKTIAEDGTESFAGHDDKSVELAKGILDRFDFDESDKKIILTLIKYHDRFLNEGEITNDNMKFLALELDNNKELFNLLLDVKTADARAKNIEVFNNFKIVKNKYLEFMNNYFSFMQSTSNQSQSELNGNETVELANEEMTPSELAALLNSVLTRRAIKSLYQPVVDLKKQEVWGYEIFARIESPKRVDIMDFFEFAKDMGKYEKLQQVLLINGIEDFEDLKSKEANKLFVNSDFLSYEKYINKPRLYDMMSRNKIIVEFQNYEKRDFGRIQDTIEQIHKNGGLVALDKFGMGTLTIDDITALNVDYIVPDMSIIQDIVNDIEKQKYIASLVTYCISNECHLITLGVEDLQTLEVLKRLGVRFVQGYYLGRPSENVSLINPRLREQLEELTQETIS